MALANDGLPQTTNRPDIPGDDFVPGDPAKHVLGKPEEKPARVHAPQPPKPGPTANTIHADVKLRLAELQGVPEEYALLIEGVRRDQGHLMADYRLSIWYAATPDDERPQEHDLTAEQVEQFVRPEVGFLHDLLALEGGGVRKLMVEKLP